MPASAPRASLRQLGEFGLIQRIRRRVGRLGGSVVRGIGDDAAVLKSRSRQFCLITTDLMAEGIHFDRQAASMKDIGYKAAVASLSDIAAMGGIPQYMVAALAIPARYSVLGIDDLYDGMLRACRSHGVKLVGGDTSASRRDLFLCLTVTGTSGQRRPLMRDGARVGDLVYVTGTLGDSCAGLSILQHRGRRWKAGARGKDRYLRFLVDRHLRPTVRTREGYLLSHRRLATAAMDLSDGLSGDLNRLCEESRVGVEIQTASLPLSVSCRWYASSLAADPTEFALQGGEDYELLFTVSPKNRHRLDRLARQLGFRFTCIGTIKTKRAGIRVRLPSGRLRLIRQTSFQHFQSRHGVSLGVSRA